ncbi:hypothetical protein HK102_000753 [Quaeritorhiza haematococci]|nr:hypothetical protein HK102_000753 [Quaeritorhiza haematococci]
MSAPFASSISSTTIPHPFSHRRARTTSLFLLCLLITFFGILPSLQVATSSIFVSAQQSSSSPCSSVAVRREWRELSEKERQDFLGAVNGLKRAPSTMGQANRYEDFVHLHLISEFDAHGVPAFLPWHRHFIREFEKALQAINPAVHLPYWDWALDSQSPERSPLLTAAYFGTTGTPGTGCITDGAFANWQRSLPQPGCLRRSGFRTMRPFPSPEVLQNILDSTSSPAFTATSAYDMFRNKLEVPHGAIHISFGGDMWGMESPNDPIFWLHHGNIDRYWWIWQMRNPANARSYNGGNATLTDVMAPFGVSVDSALETTQGGDMCYTYSAGVVPARWTHSSILSTTTASNLVAQAESSRQSTSNNTTSTDQSQPQPASLLLQPPVALTDEWIRMNRLDPSTVQSIQSEMDQVTNIFNSLASTSAASRSSSDSPGSVADYISPAALQFVQEGQWRSVSSFKEIPSNGGSARRRQTRRV